MRQLSKNLGLSSTTPIFGLVGGLALSEAGFQVEGHQFVYLVLTRLFSV